MSNIEHPDPGVEPGRKHHDQPDEQGKPAKSHIPGGHQAQTEDETGLDDQDRETLEDGEDENEQVDGGKNGGDQDDDEEQDDEEPGNEEPAGDEEKDGEEQDDDEEDDDNEKPKAQ